MHNLTKGAQVEIERKFLISTLPDSINLNNLVRREIMQAYVIAERGNELRVRKDADKYYMTVKLGSGISRIQPEVEISKGQFDTLFLAKCGEVVEKTRYLMANDAGTIELDVYKGHLKGLITAEVEFKSEDDAMNFKPPTWFGREVTYDLEYKNSALSLRGMPNTSNVQCKLDAQIQSPKEPIESNEYQIDRGFEELLRRTRSLAASSSNPIVVLVAGGSASGKTSMVALKLKKAIGDEVLVISMDNYYKGRRYVEENNINFDHPDSVDIPMLIKHIYSLKYGNAIYMPKYSFATSERLAHTVRTEPRNIIIVEGLFSLQDNLQTLGDIKVFVDLGTHGRIIRRLARDFKRSTWEPRETLRYMASISEPMYLKYVSPTKSNAHIIIRNDYDPLAESCNIDGHDMHTKFPADNITTQMLLGIGCTRLSSNRQQDIFFEPKDRKDKDKDQVIRIRNELGANTFTYKGPLTENGYHSFSFKIDPSDVKAIESIYNALPNKIIKHRITYYHPDGLVFAHDLGVMKTKKSNSIMALGDFLEFTLSGGMGKAAGVLNSLNLLRSNGIVQSYLNM